MFIRTKYDPGRNRYRVQIVHSVRDGDKVRQKILRHVGAATSEAQLEALKKLAAVILEEIKQSHSAQPSLFTPQQLADLTTQNARRRTDGPLRVDLEQCREDHRVSLGVREAFGTLYHQLGFGQLLPVRKNSANRILEELVLARIAQPRSKRGTVLDLAREAGITLNLNRVYQSMDELDERRIDQLRAVAHHRAQELFEQPLRVLFYDTTTLYFESEVEDDGDKDGLRFKGYSKDGRPNRSQVVLALLMTEAGIPLGYELYPGNCYEGNTLLEAVDQVHQRYSASTLTVVADSGLLNRDNCEQLERRGLPYILGYRLKSAPKRIKQQILDPSGYLDWDHKGDSSISRYRVIKEQGRRIVVTYCPKRARKDQKDRQRALQKLQKQLNKSDTAKSLLQGARVRYLDVSGSGRVRIDSQKVAQQARWDGLRGVVSSASESLSPHQLVAQYRQLWQIEAGFRTNKHDLKIRPVYHWTPRRIRAHIALCFMAFCCVQHLRHRLDCLGHSMSVESIRRELNALQLSILSRTGSGLRYGVPSRATAEAKRIYRSVGLRWNEVPFQLQEQHNKRLFGSKSADS